MQEAQFSPGCTTPQLPLDTSLDSGSSCAARRLPFSQAQDKVQKGTGHLAATASCSAIEQQDGASLAVPFCYF